MEEDIKLVKEVVNLFKDEETGEYVEWQTYLTEEQIQATENILNRLEQLEKELEPIHKTGIPVEVLLAEWGRLEDLEDDTDCLKHRIKELEKENKILIDTSRNMLDVTIDHYIPKSVIREKIEELEELLKDELTQVTYWNEMQYTIRVLKKLLKE